MYGSAKKHAYIKYRTNCFAQHYKVGVWLSDCLIVGTEDFFSARKNCKEVPMKQHRVFTCFLQLWRFDTKWSLPTIESCNTKDCYPWYVSQWCELGPSEGMCLSPPRSQFKVGECTNVYGNYFLSIWLSFLRWSVVPGYEWCWWNRAPIGNPLDVGVRNLPRHAQTVPDLDRILLTINILVYSSTLLPIKPKVEQKESTFYIERWYAMTKFKGESQSLICYSPNDRMLDVPQTLRIGWCAPSHLSVSESSVWVDRLSLVVWSGTETSRVWDLCGQYKYRCKMWGSFLLSNFHLLFAVQSHFTHSFPN